MSVFALSLLVIFVPIDASNDLEECLAAAPSRGHPPLTWDDDIEKMWGNDPLVSPDTLRAHLAHLRTARECFSALDTKVVARPYLDDYMRTFYVETALLAGLRRFEEAFRVFEAGRSHLIKHTPARATGPDDSGWLPRLHRNEGFLHYLLGDLSASVGHYLQAYETTPKTDPSERVQYLVDIGIIHQRMRDYRSAEYYYQRAKKLYLKSGLPTTPPAPQRGLILQNRADLLVQKSSDIAKNRPALERAQRLSRRALTLSRPGTEQHARVSILLSESLGLLGRIEEAVQLNREVRQYAQRHNDARLHAFTLLKMGRLRTRTHDWAEAETALLEALEIVEGPGNLDYQRRIFGALARLHELQEQWTEAAAYFRRGISVVERQRKSLTASQWSMTAFGKWHDMYRGLARCLVAQGKDRAALAALDRSRARHLQDLRIRAHVKTQLSASQRARLDSLSNALGDLRNRLGTADLTDQVIAALRTRQTALVAARQQILAVDSVFTRPGVADIQAALERSGRVLLSYFLDDPSFYYDRKPQSTVFLVTPDTLRSTPLPNVTQTTIQRRVRAISPLLTASSAPVDLNAMQFDLRPLYRLQETLYAPVAPLLPAERPLTVVPDGPLFRVPFSTLVRSMPGGRFAPSEARFVLHERPTALELASSLVTDSSTRPPSLELHRGKVAAFGVSEFDTLGTVSQPLRSALRPEPLDSSSIALPSLEGVRSELRAVQQRVPEARVFLDAEATEGAFRRSSETASVLHIASHAFVHPTSPLQNAFLLRRDSTRSDSDGILFLHELHTRHHPLSLVVLSGCNTARGTLQGGEGMEGLQYGFRAMGAQATLSSLWPVVDEANATLMDAFYRYIQRGLQKDEALRQAKLQYLEANPDRASPFFWAPTVLYGSPTALNLGAPPLLPMWIWWSLGLIIAALGGLLLWTRRERLSLGP